MKAQKERGMLRNNPPEFAFSLVINACAFTSGTPEDELAVFHIALDVMNELLEDDKRAEPSPTTYGRFIQACGRLRVPEDLKTKHLEQVFERCREGSRINEYVLEMLKIASSDALFARLMLPVTSRKKNDVSGGNLKQSIKLSSLPPEWVWNGYSNQASTRTKRRS
jgi:hypothetical protein